MKIVSIAAAGLIAAVAAALSVAIAAPAQATVFTFNTDPFAGTTALTDPGRQIIPNELFIEEFSIATDVFEIHSAFFGVGTQVNFINDLATNLPTGGVNIIVLQDTPTPFAAGIAADRIAEQIETDGAGFFIYFNSGLDLPRLVFSTNLNDNTADLKVLARMENLGPEALPDFTAANFALVPEPSATSLLLGAGLAVGATFMRRRGRTAHASA